MGFGGGGGYSAPAAPTYTPEKPEVSKPVTEAATAAREAQKDKAARAVGIQGSVLTSVLQEGSASAGSNQYLGK